MRLEALLVAPRLVRVERRVKLAAAAREAHNAQPQAVKIAAPCRASHPL